MKIDFSFKYNGEVFCAESLPKFEKGVSVTTEVKEYKEYDAVEWVLWFENKSDKDSGVFSEIWDCDTLLTLEMKESPRSGYMPKVGDACVITMNGPGEGKYYRESDKMSSLEFGMNYEYLDPAPNKTRCVASKAGHSSDGTMPFFDVTSCGCGYIAAIGWSGDWKAEFLKCEEGIRMKSGVKEAEFYLKPGEKIRTTSVLLMKYADGEDKYNKFRGLMRDYYSHKSKKVATRDGLMAFEMWGGLSSEEMKKRLSELKKYDIKFEDVWIDAGWYGNCTKCDEPFSGDWGEHTGDWNVNPRVHPKGLSDVAEVADENDMRLMLWFEPERAVLGTPVTKQHPDWFLTIPENENSILWYGNEDALNYVFELISTYVDELNLSCYRQDFNVSYNDYFKAYDEENRKGIYEIKHIMGMYRLWDMLLERFPQLIIDNCASGGRRIDFETAKRSIPFFRSDYQCEFNENSDVLQCHNAGISKYLPYNGCTTKTKGDTYAIRSSYSSSWGGAFYNAVFQSMTEEDFLWTKKIADEYRRIRKYMHLDFYSHGSEVLDESSWAIWQYNDAENQKGIVMAFRREKSPFERVNIELKGLQDDKVYKFTNLDDNSQCFGEKKMEICLPQMCSSVIFEYEV